MPIHDQGYRRYGGDKARERAWLVILSAGVRAMFRNRWWIVLMAASWIQFLIRAVGFYLAANFSQAAIVARGEVKNHYFLNFSDAGGARSLTGMAVRFTAFEADSREMMGLGMTRMRILH